MVGEDAPNQDKVEQSELENQILESSPEALEASPESEGVAEPASVEELLAQLAQAQQKVVDQQDSVLRAQAEVQNIRRRTERDVESAHKFALEKFSNDLLPVVDSLERALQAAMEDSSEIVKAMKDGVQLTLKMLLDALAKHGVEQLDPVGEPFNPQLHEAMSMQPSADLEPNSVMVVLQKGYTLNGRLVRPAMVMVSTAA